MTDIHKPHYRLDVNGKILRIGWPTVVKYQITEGPRQDDEPTPFMPNPETHPAPVEPPLLDNRTAARDYATGRRKVHRRSLNFRDVIYDLAEYERMAAIGWFRDPRHTGVPPGEFIDNMGQGVRKNA